MSDLEKLQKLARENRYNDLSEKSRKMYNVSNTKFILWLESTYPHLITVTLKDALETCENRESCVFSFIDITKRKDVETPEPPILFDKITAEIFVEWLLSLRTRKHTKPGATTYHRAAFYHLFLDFRCKQSYELIRDLKTHFVGIKRCVAEETRQGLRSVAV